MFDTLKTPDTFDIGGDMPVGRIGYGAMRLTGQPGNFGAYADWDAGVALLRAAYEQGVTFFDSARSYGPLWADKVVGEALGDTDAILATKGGVDKPAPDRITVDGSPDTLRRQVEDALIHMRRSRIDLFQLHRVDPETPIEVSVEALAKMQSEGMIRHIGLSNVDRTQLDRALSVAPIASVQNRFNAAERGDAALVDFTAQEGIAFIPYGPLGAHPMQAGAALDPRDALAWLMRRSTNIVAIPGSTNAAHVTENLSAWALV
ncbi:aldo/keto reductase [Tateyamaria sp. SN6-1]|uniref:aldo/keto reductase n=1 Tax=Tateyamaria sp. SN6-1 TaxID=3092148 RepID=UPI0039F62DB6